MSRYVIVLPLLMLLFLSGCALQLQPQNPASSAVFNSVAKEQIAWKAHREKMRSVTQWDIIGRAGIRSPEGSGSLNINWTQKNKDYSIVFSGPFGRILAHLSGKSGTMVTLSVPGKSSLSSSSGEALLEEETGWNIPVDAMRYWVLGIPVPESKNAEHAIFLLNGHGQLTSLKQLGWRVVYSHYVTVDDYTLPAKIELSGQQIKVVLLINWHQLSNK